MARHFKGEVRRLLLADLSVKAAEIRDRYGPTLDWDRLQLVLKDRDIAPFPCQIQFDAAPLLPGEFAHAVPKGPNKQDGYILYLHPQYATQPDVLPYLVLYQLVLINYGDEATPEDAETFGSIALGLSRDAYFQALCELSGQIGGDDLV
jgi:hypothetical protein